MTALVQPQNLKITWDEYENLGVKLVQDIKKSSWEPDTIVCIARGGMFLGDMCSRLFDKPLAIIVASSYHGEGGRTQEKLEISVNIAMLTNTIGKKILLVDDLVDSGKTLIAIKKHLEEEFLGSEIRTAVAWKKSATAFNPNYFAETVSAETWITQPVNNSSLKERACP